MLAHFFLFLFLILQPVLCLGLGLWIVEIVRRYSPDLKVPNSLSFVLGLFVYLWLVFGLKCLGVSWVFASLVPFAPLTTSSGHVGRALDSISLKANWDTVVWVVFTSVVGLTLLSAVNGYETGWPNAYGDYGLHLGMISSFVFGDNFPPEYQIFAGSKLSYPFFVNLWSASVWWISPTSLGMANIFFVHWMVVWLVVYVGLSQANRVIPWLVILGGGSLLTLGGDDGPGINEKGYFWASFLHTIWAPQRSALLGVLMLSAVVPYFHSTSTRREVGFSGAFAIIGAVVGLAFLGHGHFSLVVGMYIGLTILIRAIAFGWPVWFFERAALVTAYVAGGLAAAALPLLLIPELGLSNFGRIILGAGILSGLTAVIIGISKTMDRFESKATVSELLSYGLPLTLAFMAYPLLGEKSQTFALMNGWFEFKGELSFIDQIAAWLKTGAPWLIILVLNWTVTRRHVNFWVLVLLLVFFNTVQLSVWRWDQIKIFVAIYAIVLLQIPALETRVRRIGYGACFALLIFPSVYQLWRGYTVGTMSVMYTKDDLAKAEMIRQATQPGDVILDDGRHLSIATLAGRKVYLGYDGWLWTHGLKYQERGAEVAAGRCSANCPSYVLWDAALAKKWPALASRVTETKTPGLYRITWKN